MILMLDNRDSFVFNLERYFAELGCDTEIVDSHAITLKDIADLRPEAIIISPGPCTPNEAGMSLKVIAALAPTIPILGVCLGHQAIAQVYGSRIHRSIAPRHGLSISLAHAGTGLFHQLPNPLTVGLYHSLIAEPPPANSGLIVDAVSPDGEVMAISHIDHPLYGIQFHPESLLTRRGHALIANFVDLAQAWEPK
tara:strand:+ start:3265 stop:3849 length:585 start_codon:yes stop_codon:yes gene_type:complete